MLHLVDDYNTYGSLDNCSAFPFENYMKTLKRMLRKHEKPLQQVVKRYKEQCINENIEFSNNSELKFTTKEPDCFILTYNGNIVKITEIISNTATIIGRVFTNKSYLYIKPIKSSKLDIFVVKNLSETTNQWKILDIKMKMIIFNIDNKFIAIPILR